MFDLKQRPFLGMVRLAQAAPAGSSDCESTPEGGKVCADGTYHPPGCPLTPGAPVVQASGGFPVLLPVAAGAALIAAGAYLLSGRKLAAGIETDYPDVSGQLRRIADAITAERAGDAADFASMTAAGKRKLDALDREGKAQRELAAQERVWESSHRNADALSAAQAAYDAVVAERSQAQTEEQSYRQLVNEHANAIMALRTRVEYLIQSLPPEYADQAWVLVDPCHPVKMGAREIGWSPKLSLARF